MTVKLSTGLVTLLAGSTGLSSAFANGVMYVYSGSQPVNADAAVTGTLLGIVTKDAGAFSFGSSTNGLTWATAADGVASKSTDNWKFVGLANGTAGWARLMGNATDSLGASTTLPRLDMEIGTSGAAMSLSNISISTGVPVTIDTCAITFPKS